MVLHQIEVGWKAGSSREAYFDDCAHSCNPAVRFRRGSCLHELVKELGMSQRSGELTITAAVLW
jgi:hypothetical protein